MHRRRRCSPFAAEGSLSRELFIDEQRRIATDVAHAEVEISRLELAA
jgi:hypothetical protein